ncbi:MAG: hypothetical protein JXP34_16065 [Planctomycetes bacterium]|nr:hypothetical protein [Planctomycetota bacterium]
MSMPAETRQLERIMAKSPRSLRGYWPVLVPMVLAVTGPAASSRTPADRGREFLAGLFDRELRLLPEFRGAKVYWLSHDNCLATRGLAKSHPRISRAIAAAIRREGLQSSDGKTALLFGKSPEALPFHEHALIDVRKAGEKIIRTEIKTSRPLQGWEEYADLLFFASMAQDEPAEARRLWDRAMKLWDGKGFADAAAKGQGSYATFKLALAAVAAARLPEKPELPRALIDRLLALQEEGGGWVTNYSAAGKPIGVSNVETTCLAILGCEAVQVLSSRGSTR